MLKHFPRNKTSSHGASRWRSIRGAHPAAKCKLDGHEAFDRSNGRKNFAIYDFSVALERTMNHTMSNQVVRPLFDIVDMKKNAASARSPRSRKPPARVRCAASEGGQPLIN